LVRNPIRPFALAKRVNDMTAPRILQEPAEGSRETIEHELTRQTRRAGEKTSPQATSEDVRRILRDPDERKIIEILSLKPTVAELEQAAMWSGGEGDVLGKMGRQLTGRAAQIFEILSADHDEEDH
jgi:hypothetical protein